MTFLCFDGQGRRRARLKPPQTNGFAGLFAEAVGTIVDAGDRFVNLGDQFALTVAGAQFERPVRFRGGPVHQIGVVFRFLLHDRNGFFRTGQDFRFPRNQLFAEIGELTLIHIFFVVLGTIGIGIGFGKLDSAHLCTTPHDIVHRHPWRRPELRRRPPLRPSLQEQGPIWTYRHGSDGAAYTRGISREQSRFLYINGVSMVQRTQRQRADFALYGNLHQPPLGQFDIGAGFDFIEHVLQPLILDLFALKFDHLLQR